MRNKAQDIRVKSNVLLAEIIPCRNFSYRSSGILFIKLFIEITIESHCSTAGKDHAKNDQ